MGLSGRKFILSLGDILICYAALGLALVSRQASLVQLDFYFWHAVSFTPAYAVWFATLYAIGLYRFRAMRNLADLLQDMLWAWGVNTLLAIAVFYALEPYHKLTPKTHLLLASVFAHLGFLAWRQVWVRWGSAKFVVQRVAFIGDSDRIRDMREEMGGHPQMGFKEASLPRLVLQDEPEALWRPTLSKKGQALSNVDLIVAKREEIRGSPSKFRALFSAAVAAGVPVITDVDFYELIRESIPPYHAADMDWLMTHVLARQRTIYSFFKRWLDLALSLAALLLLSPVFLFIGLISLLSGMRKPVYRQTRFGLKGSEFLIWKFRTMREGADKGGPDWETPQPNRHTTKWGRILRRFRLDELPQLLNVFMGDMSLVGPRPEWVEEVKVLEKEVAHYHLRHLVKPGITGWAQINFRATNSPKDSLQKLQYDLYYVKHMSLAFDIRILLRTIKRVFLSESSFGAGVS
ncbi:MAG: exopolysaccharide biosynthesis polyprenyl glycosylphosphotransferase [Elusimicrobiota bacterium]